ncbi:MAG: hypothetical protein WBL93_05665 [Lutisporaceae bacterium]
MNSRKNLKIIHLIESLNQYREQQKHEMIVENNEMCENYYRVDDKPNDKRGSF